MRLVIGIGGRSTARASVSIGFTDQRSVLGFRDVAPAGLSAAGDRISTFDLSAACAAFSEAGANAIVVLGERRAWPIWEALAKEADVESLLIYEDPVAHIASRIADGADLSVAAEDWLTASARLLEAANSGSKTIRLLNAADIVHSPKAFVYYCATHFGVDVDLQATAAPALESVIAAHFVASSDDVRMLNEELMARADAFGDLELQKLAIGEAALDKLRLLTEQAGELDELRHQSALVSEQLRLVQYKVESYYKMSQHVDSKAELTRVSAELESARHEVNALRQSTSWRISAPVRLLSRTGKRLKSLRGLFAERQQVAILRKSPLFDAHWYQNKYPDIATSRLDPAVHFIRFGGREGRSPSPKFNSANYLKSNPDVSVAGINPLIHYIQYGQNEARATGA